VTGGREGKAEIHEIEMDVDLAGMSGSFVDDVAGLGQALADGSGETLLSILIPKRQSRSHIQKTQNHASSSRKKKS
jgi:hypothetical protein